MAALYGDPGLIHFRSGLNWAINSTSPWIVGRRGIKDGERIPGLGELSFFFLSPIECFTGSGFYVA